MRFFFVKRESRLESQFCGILFAAPVPEVPRHVHSVKSAVAFCARFAIQPRRAVAISFAAARFRDPGSVPEVPQHVQ